MRPPGAWAAASAARLLVRIRRDGGGRISFTGTPAGLHPLHVVCDGLGVLPLGAGLRLGMLLGQWTRMDHETAPLCLRNPSSALLHFHLSEHAVPMPAAGLLVLGPPGLRNQEGQGQLLAAPRFKLLPDTKNSYTGFRCAMSAKK